MKKLIALIFFGISILSNIKDILVHRDMYSAGILAVSILGVLFLVAWAKGKIPVLGFWAAWMIYGVVLVVTGVVTNAGDVVRKAGSVAAVNHDKLMSVGFLSVLAALVFALISVKLAGWCFSADREKTLIKNS